MSPRSGSFRQDYVALLPPTGGRAFLSPAYPRGYGAPARIKLDGPAARPYNLTESIGRAARRRSRCIARPAGTNW